MTSTELAAAYVAIVPSLKNAAREIQSQLGAVDMSGVGKSMGASISGGVGKSLRESLDAATKSAADAARRPVEAATNRLAESEHNLQQALGRRQSAAKGVEAAEARLNELRKSGAQGSAEYVRAEKNLLDAQLKATSAAAGVERAQSGVTDAQQSLATATRDSERALAQQQTTMGQLATQAPVVAAHLESVGSQMQTIGRGISGVGDSMTKYITMPAVGAATAVGGLVAGLGFKRLVGIDTARAQFEGLGYDVEAVMAQVDAGVTGTALAMNQGASLAVGALAANVPLEQLENHLKRVANTAAAYGVEAEHAGLLINQAYIDQTVTWGLLSQMQQNQIPIVSALGDTFGLTGEQIRKMASDGEISIDMLNEALDNKAGAAAEAYAQSWRGITANITANIGRIGASLLEGAFPQAKESLQEFLEFLQSDDAREWAAETGAAIGEAFGRAVEFVRGAIDWWGGLDDSTKNLIIRLGLVAVAAGPILAIGGRLITMVGGIIKGVAPLVRWFGRLGGATGGAAVAGGRLLPMLLRFAGPIGLIAASLITAWRESESFRESVGALGSALWEVAQSVWTLLKPVVDFLIPFITELIKLTADILAPVLMGLAAGLQFVAAVLRGDWSDAWSIVEPIVQGVADGLAMVVGGIINTFFSMSDGVAMAISDAVAWVASLPGQAVSAVAGIGTVLWNAGVDLIQGFINGIVSMFVSVQSTLVGLTMSLIDWKGPPSRDATLLTGAGVSIIQSLIDGFESHFPAVRNSLGGLTDEIAGMERPTLGVDLDMPVADRPRLHAAPVSSTPAWSDDDGAFGGAGRGSRVFLDITNNYPQEEPTSVTANKALQFAAALGID